jgi:hypothetical protein
MGHNNKTQKLTCTNVRSTLEMANSEYVNTAEDDLSCLDFYLYIVREIIPKNTRNNQKQREKG